MSRRCETALFVATLVLALIGAAAAGDPHGPDDTATARAAASLPAVRS